MKDGLAIVGSRTLDKVLSLKTGDTIEVEEGIHQELIKGGFICEDEGKGSQGAGIRSRGAGVRE
ncbi:MAG TPA: hypothetical protein VK186_13780 [Candidatus Deferrimicrobium sp.]|nr:hypothetical protein [Candidatus Deferrimicrobium sp.]